MSLQVFLKRDDEPDAKLECVAILEVTHGYHCLECDEYVEEVTDSPLYECNDCGTKFTRENSYNNNHQCPDCRKFSTKLADQACTVCEAGEVEEVEYVDMDGETFLVADVGEKIARLLES